MNVRLARLITAVWKNPRKKVTRVALEMVSNLSDMLNETTSQFEDLLQE